MVCIEYTGTLLCSQMARHYELKKRAERKAETRRRIVEAAVDLHTSVGPSRTSIAAIAERAGVQRHTVYAHFPDEPSLYAECTSHWAEEHPFPDPSGWNAIEDPVKRLRTALDAVYGWYSDVEADLALFRRDATLVPSYRFATETRAAALRAVANGLARGFPGRRIVRAAIGHALDFETWRSLVRRQGLTRHRAVEAMVRLVTSV
jgi:AcrR family transcriptional regulator